MNAREMKPFAELTCPLCGKPNQCAPAASGSFDTPCWCRQARIDPETLALVPADKKMKACICPACAARLAGAGKKEK